MSHFAVLVIGEDVEEQLQEFDENIVVPQYVKYTKEELIKKEKQDIEDYKNGLYAEFLKDPEKYKEGIKNDKHIKYLEEDFPKKLNWTDEEIYQDAIKFYEPEDMTPDGGVYSTYNPDSKWDWWTIGGRYRDRLVLKDGAKGEKGYTMDPFVGSLYRKPIEGRCDVARKGDVDWDKMHLTEEKFDKACRFWEMKVDGAEPETEEEENELKWDWYKPEFYTERYGNKETYAQCIASFTMWAVVKDSKWYEKGSMGFWACSDETDEEAVDWEKNFYDRFIKDLPDETLLTVVDCHI